MFEVDLFWLILTFFNTWLCLLFFKCCRPQVVSSFIIPSSSLCHYSHTWLFKYPVYYILLQPLRWKSGFAYFMLISNSCARWIIWLFLYWGSNISIYFIILGGLLVFSHIWISPMLSSVAVHAKVLLGCTFIFLYNPKQRV